ncbi:hypothetical protein VTL71DRAFT_1328 [Oculimacula yallundae]|uniref:Uncharacterized protein n=1 Tax=Oculimacula yallundae TaxID=86028 RepID=A0ABR4CCH3_9HELO
MQFPTFITGTIVLLLASSATAQSGRRAGTYRTSVYGANCRAGNPITCGGGFGTICLKGSTQSFDDTANKANVAACAGKKVSDGCRMTVKCS